MTPEKVVEVQKYGREPISLHTPLGEEGDSEFGDLIEVYERLLEKTPRSPAAEVALADMHRRRGRPEEAIRVLQAALAADSSHQEARRMLIECYLHSGQTEAALEEIDALLGYHAMAGQQPAALGPGRTSPAFATRSADS